MDPVWYASLLIFSAFFILQHLSSRNKNLPPSPPSLPIIGHLHLMKSPLHRWFQVLSKKYGPIIYLHFGSRPILVVSSPSIAEQCFTKNDIIFANRPKSIVKMHLGYNMTTVVSSPYGEHWRNLRRVTAIQIFSTTSLNTSSPIRREEIRSTARKLFSGYKGEKERVNLQSLFREIVYNGFMKMITGKESAEWYKLFGVSFPTTFCDYIPALRWIGYEGAIERKAVELHGARDKFLQGLIDEARRNMKGDDDKNTIIERFLALQEADPEYYTDDLLKGVVTSIFTAGPDTSLLTMQWAMSLLLNHPKALEKARNQIDQHVPPDRLLDDSDLPKLTYLRSIVNETLRLFPVAPLLLPHFSTQDCTIEGYTIPKGTTLMVNAWAIHRDPNVWKEPTKFVPERFEVNEIGLSSEGFKFIPFGMGRRACPGSSLAMRFVCLTLGVLIQCFEWERVGDQFVDLEEGNGSLTPRVDTLEVLYKPRPSMTNFLHGL